MFERYFSAGRSVISFSSKITDYGNYYTPSHTKSVSTKVDFIFFSIPVNTLYTLLKLKNSALIHRVFPRGNASV